MTTRPIGLASIATFHSHCAAVMIFSWTARATRAIRVPMHASLKNVTAAVTPVQTAVAPATIFCCTQSAASSIRVSTHAARKAFTPAAASVHTPFAKLKTLIAALTVVIVTAMPAMAPPTPMITGVFFFAQLKMLISTGRTRWPSRISKVSNEPCSCLTCCATVFLVRCQAVSNPFAPLVSAGYFDSKRSIWPSRIDRPTPAFLPNAAVTICPILSPVTPAFWKCLVRSSSASFRPPFCMSLAS